MDLRRPLREVWSHAMKENIPRLSVLLCTRNRPEKARRALDSILGNSFEDFELIVVDQSTDKKTGRAIDGFEDARIRYIRSPTVGLAKSRNLAIRASRSETVVFTDDDCICDENWLASIIAEYRRDPSIMGVIGRVIPYGDDNREGVFCPATMNSGEKKLIDRPVIPAYVLGGGNNMSFKKDVFREIGLFIETLGAGTWMKQGEETEFFYRALRKRTKLVYSPKPLVHHDNWLSREQFAALMQESMLGGTAVFTKFSLMMDKTAFIHLLKTAYYLLGNRLGAGSTIRGLAHFSLGVVMGIKYLFVSPPKLVDDSAQSLRLFSVEGVGW